MLLLPLTCHDKGDKMFKSCGRLVLALMASSFLVACGSGGGTGSTASTPAAAVTVTGMSFSSTPAPTDQYAGGDPNAAKNMSVPYTTSVVTVTYSDGTTAQHPLEHKILF